MLPSRPRKWLFIRTLLLMAASCGAPFFEANAVPDRIVDSQSDQITTDTGLGADQRPLIVAAVSHIKARRFSEASNLLDQVLAVFHGKLTDPESVYVSLATRADLEAYSKSLASPNKIVWLDWGFREALHLKAFIESASRRFDPALHFLAEEIKYAPTSAAPYIEQGYIQNQQGTPKAAWESYSKALDLSRRYASSAPLEATALRGMGVTQIDLGDFNRAEQLLRESLIVEPGNPVALNELEYIRRRK